MEAASVRHAQTRFLTYARRPAATSPVLSTDIIVFKKSANLDFRLDAHMIFYYVRRWGVSEVRDARDTGDPVHRAARPENGTHTPNQIFPVYLKHYILTVALDRMLSGHEFQAIALNFKRSRSIAGCCSLSPPRAIPGQTVGR